MFVEVNAGTQPNKFFVHICSYCHTDWLLVWYHYEEAQALKVKKKKKSTPFYSGILQISDTCTPCVFALLFHVTATVAVVTGETY